MAPLDALLGWDEDTTAEAYAAFTRDFPMYAATSRDLARRAELTDGRLVVDLCGGAGATAEAILELVPIDAQVVSLDAAAAMQRVGRRTLADPRLTWVTAPAEDLADHVPGAADAVVCNSAIWKTDVPRVFAAVHQVLRPGGRFVFNVGGGFAGIRHPDETSLRTGPSLNTLIRQVAARDYGYAPPPPAVEAAPKLSVDTIAEHLSVAGLTVLDTEVVAQHSTMAEKKAWLSIPVFARPDGEFTHAQRTDILDKAYSLTTPDAPTVTSWLVVVAQRPREQR
ncbi:class I SAM-dependent methyltransferase [Prauserella endophytica]|uniref:Class I SAM-dependent methyltransferase n=1 Tax=Prauserella endophytica TaxID=1592324 RepID=A0ABY2RU94_9PSEU|nr:class I SAM-dependent methyltransferase [Prauserella endophytica]TKG59136.1 class I SAM-dependent methyltransferase [Prauserella endophytica]